MIRIATEADLPAILAIYTPYVRDTTVSFEYEVPSPEVFLNRFRAITEQFPWLVWEEDGAILGYAYACRPFERAAYSWCAEPSIYVHPEAQGQGVGKRLYLALEELLRAMGYRVLLALVTGENEGSRRFHERLGYYVAGDLKNTGYKFGRWCGVFWMEKLLDSVENPMDYPVKWKEFVQSGQKICDILYNLSLS